MIVFNDELRESCNNAAALSDSLKYPCSAIAVFRTPNYNVDYRYTGRTCWTFHRSGNTNSAESQTDEKMVAIAKTRLKVAKVDMNVTSVFVVTWENQTLYRRDGVSDTNATFTNQLALVSDSVKTYAFFNYPYGRMNFPENQSTGVAYTGYSFTDEFNIKESKWLGYWSPAYANGNYYGNIRGQNPFSSDKQLGNYGK